MQAKECLFKILYLFLHTLCTVFEIVLNALAYIWSKSVNYHNVWRIKNNQKYILRNVKNITKLPTHITVLLGEEAPSVKDLANLVLWGIASDISFISFYDYKGLLKESEEKLRNILEEIKSPRDHIIWHNGESSYTNGFIGRKIHIRTLSSSDGRQTIVNISKQLISARNKEINSNTIENYLRRSYVFPDPDLGLYCGRTFNLYGYPPWQIRTTEFLSLHSHHHLSAQTFVKVLFRFSKIEQRLGK